MTQNKILTSASDDDIIPLLTVVFKGLSRGQCKKLVDLPQAAGSRQVDVVKDRDEWRKKAYDLQDELDRWIPQRDEPQAAPPAQEAKENPGQEQTNPSDLSDEASRTHGFVDIKHLAKHGWANNLAASEEDKPSVVQSDPLAMPHLQFPVNLRKMWSGSEIQTWLDKQLPEYRQRCAPLAQTPLRAEIERLYKALNEAQLLINLAVNFVPNSHASHPIFVRMNASLKDMVSEHEKQKQQI